MFAPILQNENAGAGPLQHHHHDKENVRSVSKPVLQPAGQSARKALGNITNTGSKQQQLNQGKAAADNSSKGQGSSKQAAGQPSSRRAFGVDITNSGALKQQQAPDDSGVKQRRPLAPLEQQQPRSSVKQQAQASQQQPQSKLPELWAEEGVERLAGSSWAQQEAERLAREERGLEARVKAVTSAMGAWRPCGVPVVSWKR